MKSNWKSSSFSCVNSINIDRTNTLWESSTPQITSYSSIGIDAHCVLSGEYAVPVSVIEKNYFNLTPAFNKLTVTLKDAWNCNNDLSKQKPSIQYWRILHNFYCFPSYFGLKHFGPPEIDLRVKGNEITSVQINDFLGVLKDYQKSAVDLSMNKLSTIGGCILRMDCGLGKTVIAIYISILFKRRTLVLVATQNLLFQWIQRFREFFPSIKIGAFYSSHHEMDNLENDIIVACIQSMVQQNIPDSLLETFGLVIYDEAHHIPSKTYQQVASCMGCAKLGLTATLKAREFELESLIGPIAFDIIQPPQELRIVQKNYFEYRWRNLPSFYLQQAYLSRLVSLTSESPNKNELISRDAAILVIRSGHKVLILTERCYQAYMIFNYITKNDYFISLYGQLDTMIYIGDLSNTHKRANQQRIQEWESNTHLQPDILIATYQIIAEGFDCKFLTAMILSLSGRSDIVQAIGRLRQTTRPICRVIHDYCDSIGILQGLADARWKYYLEYSYKYPNVSAIKKSARGYINVSKQFYILALFFFKYFLWKIRMRKKYGQEMRLCVENKM